MLSLSLRKTDSAHRLDELGKVDFIGNKSSGSLLVGFGWLESYKVNIGAGGMLNPGHNSESFNTNCNMQRVRQTAIMSSEVLNLPNDLRGLLEMPSQPDARIKIDYQIMPKMQTSFLA